MTETAECLAERYWYWNNIKFYAVQQSTFDLMPNFVRIAEIWPNHMTESAECLPKGITVKRSYFD